MRDRHERQVSITKTSALNDTEDIMNVDDDTPTEAADFNVPGLAEAVERKFQQWKERLIDLSLRNRLVNFKQTRSSTLKVLEPGVSVIFDHLAKEEGEYYIYVQEQQGFPNREDAEGSTRDSAEPTAYVRNPDELVYEGTPERTARVLYTLRSRAQTELEERGTNVLFVALGFLRWAETAAGSVELISPIILVPAQLERQRTRQRYRLTMASEEVIINPAIILKLRNDYGITLPDLPESPEDLDVAAFLEEVRKVVAQRATWQIVEECQLGLFSFLKFMMYKDLDANAAAGKRHRIVSALAGFPSLLPDVPPDLVTADRLDEAIKPERVFQILDADSSQQEAIVAALAGVSFVLQGPPGTGKSQTIANMISECLVAGKRVLFVSEKMAALDVVKRRLDQCGLGEFCLELHSHKANKRVVLEQLSETLQQMPVSQSSRELDMFYQLEQRRKQLNDYVRAVHSPVGALRLTPFQVNGRLARLWDSQDVLAAIPNPLELTHEQLLEIAASLGQIAANGNIYHEYETHPWKGTLLTTCSLQRQTEIERGLDSLLDSLGDAIALEGHLAAMFNGLLGRLESKLHERYSAKFMELELEELIARFAGPYRGTGKYLRYVSYRRSLRRIQRCCTTGPAGRGESAIGDLNLALLVRNGRRLVQATRCGLHTEEHLIKTMNLEALEGFVSWIADCVSAAHEIAACSVTRVLEPSVVDDLRETVLSGSRTTAAVRSGFDFLTTLFPLEQLEVIEQGPLNDAQLWVKARRDQMDQLTAWLDVEEAIKKLRTFGLAEFVSETVTRRVETSDLYAIFEKRFYNLWLDEAYRSDPALISFRSTLHEQAIDEFKILDKRLVQEAPRRIISELRSRRPDTGFATPRSSGLSTLQREIQKKRRHMSLRRLFSTVPDLLQTLKPCFLMSPLSVASYLASGQMRFDVLLFDEASQIMPEDAIGSILRSPQVIVVGDTKQLPPTRFFATLEGDEPQDDELSEDEILDSIMEEALVAFGGREKSLLWHYRSRDESLIAFSNYYFYNNRLITFPCAGTHTRPMGIEFVRVPDGVYDRSRSRTNRREAGRVAELVYQHYRQCPDRSLGVVAFSLAQADAIDAAVEGVRQLDPGFDGWCNADSHERFFIKNLENVQGDERDVMFFSVGYGPDDSGQIRMNFGPLTHAQGRRRLNVAITRAREHVKLVSSFDPSQLDLSRTHTEGVRLLKEYMEVAKHGVDAIPRAFTVDGGESESPFEEEVYEALRDKGLQVRKQIGVSGYRVDLGVVDPRQPGSFLLGIECDGSTYHSFRTARDRDRLRQQVLEGLGWTIHRIWSRDWVANRQAEIEKVIRAVRETEARSAGREMARDETTEGSGTVDANNSADRSAQSSSDKAEDSVSVQLQPEEDGAIQGVSVYVQTPVTTLGRSYTFGLDTRAVAKVLEGVVQQEGPIHKVEAARRVAAHWEISRVGYRIQARIELIARSSCPSVSMRGDFFWPASMREPPVRRPAVGAAARRIDTIALEEIQQASLIIIRRGFGMTKNDLVRETARMLGHARTGGSVRCRIESGIDRLIQRGVLRQNGDRLRADQ